MINAILCRNNFDIRNLKRWKVCRITKTEKGGIIKLLERIT